MGDTNTDAYTTSIVVCHRGVSSYTSTTYTILNGVYHRGVNSYTSAYYTTCSGVGHRGVNFYTSTMQIGMLVVNFTFKQLNMVKPIIEKTGISLRALASFVGCDHAALSRYAAGGMYLRNDVVPQLAKLYTLSVAIAPAEPAKPSEAEKTDILQAADWCRTQCQPLQKKLATTLVRYQQAGNALQLLAAIGTAPADAAPKKQRWLDTQQYEATLKLQKYGWLAQHKLQMAIQLLQQEADMLERSTG